MSTTKTAKPYKSGFCTPGNPADSHDRCPREYQGGPCVCDCHEGSVEVVVTDALAIGSLPVIGDFSEFATPDDPTEVLGTVGFHDDLNEQAYHGHPTSLSHSEAKLMLKAPALYRWTKDHPVFKDVFDFGSAAHAKVLGVGSEIVVHEFDAAKVKSPKSTNAWKEQQAEVRDRGAVLLLPDEHAQVCAMADRLSEHTLAMRLMSEGRPEVSAFALDDETGVMRRCRFDWLGPTILSDYKTAISSDPDDFVRAAINYSYHQQAAWYADLAADLGHPAAAFAFIVQMKDPPYLVTVVELPEALVDAGRRRNRVALQRFRDCVEADRWPGYVADDDFARPNLPRWFREDVTA